LSRTQGHGAFREGQHPIENLKILSSDHFPCKISAPVAFIGCTNTIMSQVATDIEAEIVSMFHRGDGHAMDRLYAVYSRYLAGVCTRYMGSSDMMKDVMQESLIKIFTRIGTFRYRGPGSLRAWLTRIVVNESITMLRQRQRLAVNLTDADPPDVPDGDEEEPDVDGLSPDVMMGLLQRLPDGYRTVLNLYAIEGHSHQEIAQMLGIKVNSSASQLHRAKHMLAKMIDDYKRGKEESR
jgi:RNA polymerase sigma factor (sigma-70 family)